MAILSLNCILLIFIPIIVVCILFIIFFLTVMLRRSKSENICTTTNDSGSFGKSSVDKKQIFTPQFISYSPDVRRSCIYGGGKLGNIAMKDKKKEGLVFTFRELETATDGFNERNVIGNGGFGVVFRGKLSDGMVVAIKVLHREGRQREREFRMEVDLLNRLHSRYLVGLIGYCADQNHRLLVFEYMSNGSLQKHLHPSSQDQYHQPLNWSTRLRIALDCARGLEFLHEHTNPAVIHRDFKSSNVLLDHNFRAKVSDFGMAKTGSDKVNGQTFTRVLGTSGYVAPEYASTGRLTTKSDVYSYGIVLLQLLTGRLPVDISRPPDEQVLVSWALPRLTNRDKLVEMVDPALQGHFSRKELIQVAAIAAVCVQAEAEYRPLITDVVQSLVPLAKIFSGPAPSSLHHQVTIS